MDTHTKLATIILAAGKGTRMKSPRAKVLHEVFHRPMVHHVLKATTPLNADKSIVIVGHQKDAVEKTLSGFTLTCVEQKEQNGTGHAVLCAEQALADFNGNVMILCGDSPLLLTKHLREMSQLHTANNTALTIITTRLEDPTNYGRIITDKSGNVVEVVEEKDATPVQRRIKEINAGIYYVKKDFLFEALKQITDDNSQGEMYLTDIVAIAVRSGLTVQRYEHPCPSHVLGVNSRVELAQAHIEIQARRNNEIMANGITMFNPPTISVAPEATIGINSILSQHITITGKTAIGENCIIEPGVCINDAVIGNNVMIGANSVVANCTVDNDTIIAPLSTIAD